VAEPTWRVPVRGQLSDDALGRLTAAGIHRLGGHELHTAGGPSGDIGHGLYLKAESSEDAAAKVRSALADVPCYVDEDGVKPVDGDILG